MQTGEDTTVRDGARLALWKVNRSSGLEPHATRVVQSDGKAHAELQGRRGRSVTALGVGGPTHLILKLRRTLPRSKELKRGLPKVAQACL